MKGATAMSPPFPFFLFFTEEGENPDIGILILNLIKI